MAHEIEQQFGIQITPIWFEDPKKFNPMNPSSDPAELARQIKNKAAHPTDQNAARYLHDVRVELRRILCSRAGKALASCLRFHSDRAEGKMRGKAVEIRPIEFDECVAEEIAFDPKSLKSTIGFSPATLKSTCTHSGPAQLPHEKLHHELVHALRRISGHMHARLYGDHTLWGNSEEFLAVLLTDIFISDRTNTYKTGLRGSYPTHAPMEPYYADSFRFFRLGIQAYSNIAHFCSDNHVYSRMLANVPAPFNPIAAYIQNQAKAFDIAMNGDADASLEDLGTPDMDRYMGPNGTFVSSHPMRSVPTPKPAKP